MNNQLTNRTIRHYLPIIQAIYASMEVSQLTYDIADQKERLSFLFLEKEFDGSKLHHAINLIGVWLKGTKFKAFSSTIEKIDKKASWNELLEILDQKILEYGNDVAIIEIVLKSNGRITRQFGDQKLTHDFEDDGMKKNILINLASKADFSKTSHIQAVIGSMTSESTSKIIGRINSILENKLKLPKQCKFVESKQGSGYRINPIYNLLIVD
jgi:hypothetical protein